MSSITKTHFRDLKQINFWSIPGLPRNQPARNSNASQACHLFFIPGLCPAQLTSNTDNKVQKLVTVFALSAFYTMTLISINLDSAPVPAIKVYITWQIPGFVVSLYRDTRKPQINCTMTAKTSPYPPCTVTVSWLKYLDTARMLRRVTFSHFIAGPLALILTDHEYL